MEKREMKPRRTGRFPDNINCGYPLIHPSCAHLNAYYRRWVGRYPAVIPALGGWGGKRWVWNGYGLGCKNRVQGTLEQTEHLPRRNKTTLCWHWFFWIKKNALLLCLHYCIKVRGQLCAVTSLLLHLWKLQGLDSGDQACTASTFTHWAILPASLWYFWLGKTLKKI